MYGTEAPGDGDGDQTGGKVCPMNTEEGGCEQGACLPFWSECFVPAVDFTSCDDACAAEGKSCVYLGCGLNTMKTHSTILQCQVDNIAGDDKYQWGCDQALPADEDAAKCCCDVP